MITDISYKAHLIIYKNDPVKVFGRSAEIDHE